MDEAQVKALLDQFGKDLGASLMGQITKAIDERVKPIEEALTQPDTPPAATDKPKTEDPAPDSPTAKRLADLEKQLADEKLAREQKERQIEDNEFEGVIKSAIGSKKVLTPDFLSKALYRELREGAVKQGDNWLTKDGKPIGEAIDTFLGTAEGKHFLPAQSTSGTGTPKNSNVKSTSDRKPSVSEVLAAFQS